MKYRIKYNYTKSSYEENVDIEDYLDQEWNNLNIAKENLKRIKEHYECYKKWKSMIFCSKEQQEFDKELSTKDWYDSSYFDLLRLKLDNGEFSEITIPWSVNNCVLNRIKIEEYDDEMEIFFR